MYTLLWLLLPVAAASGWFIARNVPPTQARSTKDCSQAYFRGLNYLLNERPDKAIEVFSQIIDADPEMVDTQIALGSLFRRQGEVDRAIRLHQNLVDHGTLTAEQRMHALLELGHDYSRAGLLDRAEALLLELVAQEAGHKQALRLLQSVYQQEKEWQKAIDIVRRLEQASGADMRNVIAHYHCEIADTLRKARNWEAAHQELRLALACDPVCVRASIMEGELFVQNNDYTSAIQAYQRVADQDPAFLSEVIEPMLECHYQLDQYDGFADYLQRIARSYGGHKAALVSTDLLRREHGDRDAAIFVAHYLNEVPSLQGLLRLVDINLAEASGELRDTFRIIRNTLERLLDREPEYRCLNCGFGGKLLHWLCPSCKTWNGMRPVAGIVSEQG